MMVKNMAVARVAFKALFVATLAAAVVHYDKLATVVDDDADQLNFGWMGDLPGVRKWVGDRVIHNLVRNGMVITPEPFELTIGVKLKDLASDRLNIVKPRIADMTGQLARHPDRMFFDLLANGFDRECYDGQYFFDTDHPVLVDGVATSVSNKGTAAFSVEALATAMAAMESLCNDAGDPLEVQATHLIVSPQNYDEALRAVNADIIEGTTNYRKGVVQVVKSQRLAKYPTRWFLLDCSREIRPLVVQRKKMPEFVAMDAPEDEARFMRGECRYGVDAEFAVGYGLWQLAWGSTGTT